MQDLPTPKIGNVTGFTINAPDLEESWKYYEQLGFRELWRADWPFQHIQITDGAIQIMLRKGDEPYIAMTYYVKEIDKVAAELEEAGISFAFKPKDNDMIKRYLIKSPDGVNISLVAFIDGFVQPEGPTMLKMPQSDFFNPDKYPNKTCGLFGEFAQPVADLSVSIAFWEKLGFKAISRFESPYPWAILSDGISIAGLHQTGHFKRPAITYFASDIKAKIEKLKENGMKDFADEPGSPGNFILTTPEKQNIFLFKLGM